MPKHGSNIRAKDLAIDHAAQMRRVEQAGVGEWEHPSEIVERDGELERLMELAARLSRIWQWVSEGHDGGTMDMRIWSVLYVMRPDLLKGQTMRNYARERRVVPSRVHSLVQEFRDLFPDVKFTKASRVENHERRHRAPRKASL